METRDCYMFGRFLAELRLCTAVAFPPHVPWRNISRSISESGRFFKDTLVAELQAPNGFSESRDKAGKKCEIDILEYFPYYR